MAVFCLVELRLIGSGCSVEFVDFNEEGSAVITMENCQVPVIGPSENCADLSKQSGNQRTCSIRLERSDLDDTQADRNFNKE
jgi:hypothetical protein